MGAVGLKTCAHRAASFLNYFILRIEALQTLSADDPIELQKKQVRMEPAAHKAVSEFQ